MKTAQQIRPDLTKSAAESIYDGLAILGGLVVQDPKSKKNVLLIRSQLADALIDLHNAGVTCPKPLPRDPLGKKPNPS